MEVRCSLIVGVVGCGRINFDPPGSQSIGHDAVGVFDRTARRELGALADKARCDRDEDDDRVEDIDLVHERGIAVLTSSGTKQVAVAVENGMVLLVVVALGWPQDTVATPAGT